MKYPMLYEFIKQMAEVPESEWVALEEIAQIREFKKNATVLGQGDIAQNLYMVISGAIRMFYIEDNGREFNHTFMFETNIAAGYPSLVSGEPSKFAIETLEDSVLLAIGFQDFQKFYDRHPCWDRVGRKALEWNYLDKLSREGILLMGDTYKKYCRTLELYPGIDKRTSQYHIASFIGVSPEALNRVLKKMNHI